MKVLFIHRFCGKGGVTVGIRKKFMGLRDVGIKADFLFLKDTGGTYLFDDIDINLYNPQNLNEIESILNNNHYDVISSIDCPEVHRILEKVTLNVKVICEVHTPYSIHRSYLKDGNLPVNIQCIVTPSKTFKYLIRKELKDRFKDIPIHVIPNPVENNFLKLSGRSSYTFPRKIIGWIGRFDETKNPIELFNIASAFASRNDIEFYIVGNPPNDKFNLIFSEIRKFKGRINFIWLPFIDHRKIHNFYNMLRISSGCFLSTSKGECFCNTVIESMACCCPVVASNIDVFKEMLEDGDCGSLYRLGNIKEATKTIIRTLEDHAYRDKIVQNAYNKVKENLTIAKVSLQWKSLFDMLLNV